MTAGAMAEMDRTLSAGNICLQLLLGHNLIVKMASAAFASFGSCN